MKPQKNTIAKKALNLFRKRTQMDADFLYEKNGTDLYGDGIVRIAHEGKQWEFEAEVKLRVNRATIALLKQNTNNTGKCLLITEYVNPELAEDMRHHDIPFIDAAGNAFINATPLYIFVKGEKPDKALKTEPVKRLFKPAGLKLIFALLNNPGMEKATHRDMANAAGIALGTVNFALTELKELGFLFDLGKRGRHLLKTKQLLRRWIEAYPEQLRPKLVQGTFRVDTRNWWKNITLAEFGAFWGGEIAAAKLTGYLKPEKAVIYMALLPGKFVFKHKLKKDLNGNVEILKPFWNFQWTTTKLGLVPPLLVYADLMATGDARNIDAAEMIYDEHLAGLVRED